MRCAECLIELQMCGLEIFCVGGVVVIIANENNGIEGCDVLDNGVFALSVTREAEIYVVNVESSRNNALIGGARS